MSKSRTSITGWMRARSVSAGRGRGVIFRKAFPAFIMLGLVGCAAPATTCHVTDVADLAVLFGHDGLPVIIAELNGHPLHMLIDTGAATSLITPEIARALNISDDFSSVSVSGLNGKLMAPATVSQDLSFGRVDVGNEAFLVAKIDGHFRKGDIPIDGLIGNDILQHLDVALDFPDQELSLLLPGNCAQVLPPWPGTYGNLPLRTADNASVEIPIEIDGTKIDTILDTGAGMTILSSLSLQAKGIVSEQTLSRLHVHTTGLGALRGTAVIQRFAAITIGPETFQNRLITTAQSDIFSNLNIDGILGEDYLRDHRVLIANSSHLIYLGFQIPSASQLTQTK